MDCDIKLRSLRKIPRYGSDFQHYSQTELCMLANTEPSERMKAAPVIVRIFEKIHNKFAT